MGQCLMHKIPAFKAILQVTASPGSTVTATLLGGTKVFSGITDSNGVLALAVKKKGTYTVTSNATGSQTKTIVVVARDEYPVNVTGSFTITIGSQKVGSTNFTSISVSRTSSPLGGGSIGALTSGAVVYQGDVLTASVSANTGFTSPGVSTGGAITKSGNNYIVGAGDCSLTGTASPVAVNLTLTNVTGANATLNRKSSPYKGAATGNVAAGTGVLYYGDTFTVASSVTNSTVYNAGTPTVTGASGSGTYTVGTSAITVKAAASVKSFTITLSKGSNTSLSLKKSQSPYANSGVNSTYTSSFTAYYGDKFVVTASASTNYSLTTLKWGNTSITSGSTQTATGAVTVTSGATATTLEISVNEYVSSTKDRWLFTFTAAPGNVTWGAKINSCGSPYQYGPSHGWCPTIKSTSLEQTANNYHYDQVYFGLSSNDSVVFHYRYESYSSDGGGTYQSVLYKGSTWSGSTKVKTTDVISGGKYYINAQ